MSEKRSVDRCTPARGLLPITSRRASTDLQQPGRSPKWNSRSSRAPLIIMLVLVPIPSLQHHHQHPPPSIILFRRRAITLQYHRHQQFRKDYVLGEAIRSPSHMTMESTPERAFKAVAGSLHKSEFAFIKRSDGSYCIVHVRRVGSSFRGLSYICHVSKLQYCTKTITRNRGSELVRLVAAKEMMLESLPPTLAYRSNRTFHVTLENTSGVEGTDHRSVHTCISVALNRDDYIISLISSLL